MKLGLTQLAARSARRILLPTTRKQPSLDVAMAVCVPSLSMAGSILAQAIEEQPVAVVTI